MSQTSDELLAELCSTLELREVTMIPDHDSPAGSKAVVHVHQQKIRCGEPAIIVRRRGKSRHFTRVEIDGSSTIIHTEDPDRCGARVTIETWAEIRCFTDWVPEERLEAV